MPWQQLHLQCQKPQVDLAESLLLEEGALSIVLEDAGDQPLFEPMPGQSPLWDEVILTAIFSADMAQAIENIAQEIATQTNASRVWSSQVSDKDWEREWMSHYHPIECANDLWIVPNWIQPPNPQATNIIMDPGLAFGTGYHATTRLCLDWLTEQQLKNKIVIDYGCGSGILGIAALLLGAKHVYAVDIDPQAVLATNQNAERNNVHKQLTAFLPDEFNEYRQQQQLDKVDIITANILAKPLMQLAPYFATLIKPQGQIVLAGLIEPQLDEVKQAFATWFDLPNSHSFKDAEDSHWHRLSGLLTD
ncbi:50S ribosomal protein L11 methyltransferase [Psychrobacter sp. I-STPA10]|uniref:50S ribosomal protein L11 methyltransferase n=1 Tax=Psychrobacter sp. I-STPA10 TaxID=2585769 RepID=UPI001E4F6AF7|nr:50S ribosomal protein L11 methyltransferase [Psychrobacter sp. I-STPA10]